MSLNDLAPANTKRARESASRSFLKFLSDKDVGWEYLEACMLRESAPLVLGAVVDKFGIHLAFKEGRKGQLLARHSVMQYYRQAKNWLLDQFPQHRAVVDTVLLEKGQILERYCMKRESGAFVNKAPACTKKVLKQMMSYLYSTAGTAADYQEAALVCLLWFLFGRASDLTMLRKANSPIGSGDIFFVHFIRIKTSEEQGLSLFPDEDFTTCPLLAIALALVSQSSPTLSLLSQLSEQQSTSPATLSPTTPLSDLIDHPDEMAALQGGAVRCDQDKASEAAPGVHSYVNRVLDRVAKPARVSERLTTHSFRRGGAQHANGAGMCVQWIFDRGAWNMTATNKAFAYVFNTPSEDHKVARVLSSLHPDKEVSLLSLGTFDSDTQAKIRSVSAALFSASTGLETAQYNVNGRVLDTLMAYLLRHYPSVKGANPTGLAIQRIEVCAVDNGFTASTLLAWSSHLICDRKSSATEERTKSQDATTDINKRPVFVHQAALIEQLIHVNQKIDARMATMETKIYNTPQETTPSHVRSETPSTNEHPVKRRRTSSAPTNLMDVWFTWYVQVPRMWSSVDGATKHARSTAKLIVAFMKLFLADGFQLNETTARYRDDVLEAGTNAEHELLSFLRQRKITVRGSQNVLKNLRKLHKAGLLNTHVRRYQQLQVAGHIVDPAPPHTTNIIALEAIP